MPDDLTVEELARVIQLAVRLRLERGMERNLAVVEAEKIVMQERVVAKQQSRGHERKGD